MRDGGGVGDGGGGCDFCHTSAYGAGPLKGPFSRISTIPLSRGGLSFLCGNRLLIGAKLLRPQPPPLFHHLFASRSVLNSRASSKLKFSCGVA